jgi:hypothetical protein
MRYPSKPQATVRPTAPGVGPFVIDQTGQAPWLGYLVDQNGVRVLGFNLAPGKATGCSPSQARKRLAWLETAINEAWNKEQSVAAIGRAFSGEKA